MSTIGLLVYPDVQALDVTGPMDVFATANQVVGKGRAPYRLCTIGLDADAVSCESGLQLLPATTLDAAPEIDTLLIPGGRGSRVFDADARLLDWIRTRAGSARRVVSICTGLYVFAATGLLEGRRVTTHWQYAADLRRRYPGLRMDADQLFVRDGRFYTSGGLTAGLDLSLALVEEDLGSSVALAVARELVMYMKRPGNQAQFSVPLDAQTRASGRMGALIAWLLEHLDEDLGVERLADRMAMSARNFRRVFAATFDATPADYVERLRLERACVLLTSGSMPVERIGGHSRTSRAWQLADVQSGQTRTIPRGFDECPGLRPHQDAEYVSEYRSASARVRKSVDGRRPYVSRSAVHAGQETARGLALVDEAQRHVPHPQCPPSPLYRQGRNTPPAFGSTVRPRGQLRGVAMRTPIAVLLLCLLLPSHVAGRERELHLQQVPGQRVEYVDGTGWVSTGDQIRIAATIAPDGSKRAWVTLVVWNDSDRAITISESYVRAISGGTQLKTYTVEELRKSERRRQNWQKFGMGLAAGLNSYAASQQGNYTSHGTVSGNYSSYGAFGHQSGRVSGTVTVSGRDAAAAALAQAQATATNIALITQLREQQAARTASLEERLLKAQTIQPGNSYGGDVAIQLPRRASAGQPIAVQVWIENDARTFYVFVDGPPSSAQLSTLAKIPPHSDDQPRQLAGTHEPSEAQPTPAPIPVAFVETPVPAASAATSAAAPVDSRRTAAAKLLVTEGTRSVVTAIAPVFRETTRSALTGSAATNPELRTILSDARTDVALAEAALALGDQSQLMPALEEVLARELTYEQLMQVVDFMRSDGGRAFMRLMYDMRPFEGIESKLIEPSDEAMALAATSALRRQYPSMDADRMFTALDLLMNSMDSADATIPGAASDATATSASQPQIVPVSNTQAVVSKANTAPGVSVILPTTGLEWYAQDSGADTSWQEATDYCAGLGGAWRLASVSDLRTLISHVPGRPCGRAMCNVPAGITLTSHKVWSNESRRGNARALDLSNSGSLFLESGSDIGMRALCVRGS